MVPKINYDNVLLDVENLDSANILDNMDIRTSFNVLHSFLTQTIYTEKHFPGKDETKTIHKNAMDDQGFTKIR